MADQNDLVLADTVDQTPDQKSIKTQQNFDKIEERLDTYTPSIYSSATAAPTADNDGVDTATLGTTFGVGDMWRKVNTDDIYICKDSGTGAAVWERMLVETETPYLHTSATAAPSVNNDGADTAVLGVAFKKGDKWIQTDTKREYTCVDSSTGAAVWRPTLRCNVAAAADAAVTDDIDQGYIPGDTWINLTGPKYMICIDNANGAADWNTITQV